MEQMQELIHPGDDQLKSFWAGALSPEALEQLIAHVDECQACESRLEAMEPAFSQYRRAAQQEHARTPRTAQAETDLWNKMEEIEARRAPRRMTWRPARRHVWISGIMAAAIALAVIALPRAGGPESRAESLLKQAASSARRTSSGRRLRIRTRNASFYRPAVLRSAPAEESEEAAIRARFIEARYDWNDPLSPKSYLDWRHNLRHKTSKLSTGRDAAGQPEQSIETRTDDGALQDASLTFDAQLAPVSGWFRFADQERVEITTEPDSGAESLPVPSPSTARIEPPPHSSETVEHSAENTAERELEVRLAIDALHTEAGEPIEVSVAPDGSIVVIAYRLDPELETELRSSLERIQGVTLRPAAAQSPPIAQSLGEPLDRVTHTSQDVSFEAHFLAELENRFNPDVEATLSAPSKVKLWELRAKHVSRMNSDLARLERKLEEQRPGFRPAPADPLGAPQVQGLANCAATVDRLITQLLAAGEPDADQGAAWRQLGIEFGRLKNLAGGYSRVVEQHRKELP
jgi:hypothetical protein